MGVNQHGFDNFLSCEVILSFSWGLWKLSTRNCFLFRACFTTLFTWTVFYPHKAVAFAGSACWGFWGDCSCVQGSTVWFMRVCFIFILQRANSQGTECCEARLPMLNLFLDHWSCLRGHVIVGQPNSNRSHTLLSGIAARRRLQVSLCCCWTGYSYCLLCLPW